MPSSKGVRVLGSERSHSVALCGGCHLANYKVFDATMLKFYTKLYSEDSGLRPPTLREFMEADKLVHEQVFILVNKQGWSLDGALYEVSQVRNDISSQLQPRPRPPRSTKGESKGPWKGGGKGKPGNFNQGKDWNAQTKGKPVQKGGGRGRGSGKPGGKDRNVRPRLIAQWNENWHLRLNSGAGQSEPICMRYNLQGCSVTNCRFKHVCPVPKQDGSACGQRHPASQCPLRNAGHVRT